MIVVDQESELVVLDLTSRSKTFRLIAMYRPTTVGKWNYFYHCLENFLVTSKTLVMSGNFNVILDERQDNVASNSRKSNSGHVDLMKLFRLVDRYRSDNPFWT